MKPGLGARACTRAGSCQPRRTDHYEHFFCSGDGGWWLRTPACTHMGRAPQHAAATSCKRTGPNAVYDWRQRPRSPRDLYPTGAKVRSSDAHETFQPIRRAHRHVCRAISQGRTPSDSRPWTSTSGQLSRFLKVSAVLDVAKAFFGRKSGQRANTPFAPLCRKEKWSWGPFDCCAEAICVH